MKQRGWWEPIAALALALVFGVANERSILLKISTASFAKLRREAPALAEPFLHALGQILVGRLRTINKRYVDSVMLMQSLTPMPHRKPGGRSVRMDHA